MPNGVRRYGAVRPEQIRVFPNRLPRHSDRHGGQLSHADADASWMRPYQTSRTLWTSRETINPARQIA